jgi:glucose/arabinose dehydrogenase
MYPSSGNGRREHAHRHAKFSAEHGSELTRSRKQAVRVDELEPRGIVSDYVMNRLSSLASASPFPVRRLSGRGFRLASGAALAAALMAPSARASVTLAMGEPAEAFDVTVLADGLQTPTEAVELPDGRVVITQRLGGVVVVGTDGNVTEAGTIQVDPEFQEQGLVGMVADPDFATNNTLYFFASVDMNVANKNKIYKITLGADSMLDTARMTIIDQGLAGPLNHIGGGIAIHDGKLFVAAGDTGHNSTPPTNKLGTCLNSPNGKILRVNLDGSIPDDNPLSGADLVTGCEEWDGDLTMLPPDKRNFFWGFRNPYRFWIDPQTTRMWIGDVGETTKEEISVSAPLNTEMGAQGQHFGWPFREGMTNYSQNWQPSGACMGVSPARECVGPVYEYGHTQGNACVIGGLIPDGCSWEAPWNQRYFFGDNSSGRVWTLDVTAERDGVVENSVKDFARTSGIASFHMGQKGAFYFVEATGGLVSKITPKGLDPATCGPMGGSGGMGGTSSGGSAGTDASGGNMSAGGADGGMSAGGTNATGGTGGTGGSGGTGVTAGRGGTGTGGSTGGTSSATGGSAGRGGTGTGGTGGTGATAGSSTAGTGGTGSDDSGGCGCRVAGSGSKFAAFGVVLGGLSLMRLRSRLGRRRKAG